MHQMVAMGIPMLAGTFSMTAFNLADTWFVSRLGIRALAGMSFTFPVAMVMGSVAMALGTGTSVAVSQALGEGRREHARRTATDCLLLTFILVECLGLGATVLIRPLLALMNAPADVFPLSRGYLLCYLPFAGLAFLAMPANAVLRSAGNTRWPSFVMVCAAVMNCVLDPILIFGWGPVPAWGIRGAAAATVVTRIASLAMSLAVLHGRYRLLARPHLKPRDLVRSWGHVLHIAAPSLLSYLLQPAAMFLITGIVARHGKAAVAAFGAGGRIEMFAYLIPMALGISLVPLVGQNYGAGRYDRVEGCRRWGERLALGWGCAIAVLFFLIAPWMAGLFTKDPEAERHLVLYLRIMPFGYGLREVHRYLTISLNAISRPLESLALNAAFLGALVVPLAMLGGVLFEAAGVFGGMMLGSNLAGIMALVYGRYRLTEKALRR